MLQFLATWLYPRGGALLSPHPTPPFREEKKALVERDGGFSPKCRFALSAILTEPVSNPLVSNCEVPKNHEVPATVSPAAPPQRGSVQTAPIVLRGGMLKSGECWGRGESRGAGGRHSGRFAPASRPKNSRN